MNIIEIKRMTWMKRAALIFLITVSSYFPSAYSGEVYKWIDADGKAHFSDTKPNSDTSKPLKLRVNSVSRADYSTSDGAGRGQVVMYSASWCGYCKKARAYFKENDIAYTDYDIEADRFAKINYDRLGGRGVPLILVGDKQMRGFSIASFERMVE